MRTITFSNSQIDLSLHQQVAAEMMAMPSVFRPDKCWEDAEARYLDYLKSTDEFFQNHVFEDRRRLGVDSRRFEDFDWLGLHREYTNARELPFSRGIDHANKILKAFAEFHPNTLEASERIYVLEVGGGYGRAALFLLNYLGKRACYVNVEAVPSAILISEQFLKANCREDLKIGGYADVLRFRSAGKPIDFDAFNFLTLPAWEMDQLPGGRFDILMNIWSMQEMNRRQERLYYRLWDRVAARPAVLFFLNVEKRKMSRGYRFPTHWRFLFEGPEPTYSQPERLFLLDRKATVSTRIRDLLRLRRRPETAASKI